MNLAEQLGHEIVSRLSVVALLAPGLAGEALDDAPSAACVWARALTGPDASEGVAGDVYEALWRHDTPPVEWWATVLGRRLAELNVDPGGTMPASSARLVLGWSKHRVKSVFGVPPFPVRAVLDELVSDTA